MSASERHVLTPPPEHDVESVYELSPLQEGLLVESLANPAAGLYLEQVVLDLVGTLSPPAMARAWRAVVDRQPILRTSFHWEGLERPLQVVHRRAAVAIAHNELRALPPARRDAAVRWFLQEDRARGFRFDRAPLLRVAMLQQAAAAHCVVVTLHHILLDGWSIGIVLDEVAQLYRSYVDGVPGQLEAARPYSEYIAWLRSQDRGPAEEYWRNSLGDVDAAPPLSRLGRGVAGRSVPRLEFAEHERTVPSAVATGIRRVARERRITTNVVVLGAWGIVLGAELGTTDLVVGAVVSGRDAPIEGIDTVVGLCINTVPARIRIRPDLPVGLWLDELHAEQLELRDFHHCALTDVQGWSGVPRAQPLFESIFIFENHATLQRPPTSRTPAGRAFERTSYPLTVLVGVVPDLSLKILYDTSVVGREALERLSRRLIHVLEEIARDPTAPVAALFRTTAEEELRVLELGEGPAVPPPAKPVHALISDRARRSPRATALVDDGRRVSFADLDRPSDALARSICSRGVGEGAVVGIFLGRSAELVIALLAVLKSGAAYLPLEPSTPPERLRFMLEDSGATLVVTDPSLRSKLPPSSVQVLFLAEATPTGNGESAPLPAVSLDAPAWLLYTSGSTGLPKGVLGSHRGLVNRVVWGLAAEPFSADEVCCLKTRLTFVDSLWELLGPLAAGVPLVVAGERALRDPRELVELIVRERVTRLVAVPSLLAALADDAPDGLARSRLRRLTSSGEPLTAALARRLQALLPHCALLNLYGSTEVTADATWHEVADEVEELVPIGRPLPNTRVRLLGATGELVPIGAVGELHVGGVGLATGYVGHAAESEQGRFLPDPFLPGERLYGTGDLARWRPDGQLEFIGRADRQLKIRGVRVEPGEVERAICAYTGVHEAAVIARTGAGGPELVAFVAGAELQLEALRPFLRVRLPEQLMPTQLVALERLPRLPSGKCDRAALAERSAALEVSGTTDATAPRTTAERLVAEAFAETLGRARPGAFDDFFALGGHSLLATRLASALGSRLQLAVPLAWIFEHPVVADLARTIQDALVADMRREADPRPVGRSEVAERP